MTYKTICKCDHDKDSHYKENDGKRSACLARGCECKSYFDPLNPPKPKEEPKQEPKPDKHGIIFHGCVDVADVEYDTPAPTTAPFPFGNPWFP